MIILMFKFAGMEIKLVNVSTLIFCSESIQSLITLAYETLQEATESSPECALQMFLAVSSMFEMFCEVVPTHHGKTLETFPQIAGMNMLN